ncbi:MAG: hypothetical protein EOM46_20470 [Gammaproteobacteria bacterium]|nr:hypothetical protein [Gammaproteobacteria bacterium]
MDHSQTAKELLKALLSLILVGNLLLSGRLAGADTSPFNLRFHPAGLMDGAPFTVAEDLMGTLLLISESGKSWRNWHDMNVYPDGINRAESSYCICRNA